MIFHISANMYRFQYKYAQNVSECFCKINKNTFLELALKCSISLSPLNNIKTKHFSMNDTMHTYQTSRRGSYIHTSMALWYIHLLWVVSVYGCVWASSCWMKKRIYSYFIFTYTFFLADRNDDYNSTG